MKTRALVGAGLCAALLGLSTGPTGAQLARPALPAPIPGSTAPGSVVGVVVDAATGEPLATVQVHVLELGRADLSHGDGEFHFDRLPEGRYTLSARRIGYAPAQLPVRVLGGDTTVVRVELQPSAIEVEGIVVTGSGRARDAADVFRPVTALGGQELNRQLGATVAATLAGEPGIQQRYNGPTASQPVIRGLGGDRVLVLEDGTRTGDVSSTSADHAVTIEPLTADRIEVVRGPAGLLYGSNALGGVVNVVREEVPRTRADRLIGTVSLQGESVNRGMTAGGVVHGSVGSVALRGEASGRWAGDTHTPLGVLPSTEVRGYNAAAGASWVRDAGFVGAAVRDYALTYGVPGTFGGQTIPGAHEGGVEIELRRTAVRAEAALPTGFGPFNAVEWTSGITRFWQNEMEPGGTIGSQFGQVTGTGNLLARHKHAAGELRTEGAIGAWGLGRDFAVSGSSTGSRAAGQVALAGFVYEELAWSPLRLQAGARYDWTRISPHDRRAGAFGEASPREFGAFSGSLALLAEAAPGVALGASVARAFRTPSIEELYSNGPHLADYSYNVGNSTLEPEIGVGVDLFARVSVPRLHGEAAVFRNQLDGFIYYAPTGEMDPRLGRFPVYRASQGDAVLEGAEGSVQWEAIRRVVLSGGASYVRGTLVDDGSPLPAMPPLHATLGARYDARGYFLSLGWEGAARQDRVGEFEGPTGGRSLWNAGAGVNWTTWGRLQTLTLQVENALNESWRDHLSRIRAVAPQPGRNVRLLYRVNF